MIVLKKQPYDLIKRLQDSSSKMQEATCLLVKKIFHIEEEPLPTKKIIDDKQQLREGQT